MQRDQMIIDLTDLANKKSEGVLAMMNYIKVIKEELDLLRSRGFTDGQIRKLCRLRKTYGQDQMDQPALDIRHHAVFCVPVELSQEGNLR
jgi:hypothetical protein